MRVAVDVDADRDDRRLLTRRERAHDVVQVLRLDRAVVAAERIDERDDHRAAAERGERDRRAVLVAEREVRRAVLAAAQVAAARLAHGRRAVDIAAGDERFAK